MGVGEWLIEASREPQRDPPPIARGLAVADVRQQGQELAPVRGIGQRLGAAEWMVDD
jgi:hypothetical protein